jgi:hypothetical protein
MFSDLCLIDMSDGLLQPFVPLLLYLHDWKDIMTPDLFHYSERNFKQIA